METLHLASRTEITPEAAAGYAARLACIALASVQALTLQVRPWPRCRTPDCNAQNCVPVLKRGTGGCSQIHVLLKSLAWLFQLFYGMGREERGRGVPGSRQDPPWSRPHVHLKQVPLGFRVAAASACPIHPFKEGFFLRCSASRFVSARFVLAASGGSRLADWACRSAGNDGNRPSSAGGLMGWGGHPRRSQATITSPPSIRIQLHTHLCPRSRPLLAQPSFSRPSAPPSAYKRHVAYGSRWQFIILAQVRVHTAPRKSVPGSMR